MADANDRGRIARKVRAPNLIAPRTFHSLITVYRISASIKWICSTSRCIRDKAANLVSAVNEELSEGLDVGSVSACERVVGIGLDYNDGGHETIIQYERSYL